MPNGTRRRHYRKGKPVRATNIKGRKPPKRRLNAGARRRARSKPLLLAAGTLAGLGALDAILTGRWGGALVLGCGALGFLVGHLVWSRHKRRQALKAPKPRATRSQAQQRQEALEKARAAHQPSVEQDFAAARARDAERLEALAKQRRYDNMQATNARQRKLGIPELVSPSDYEEFFDGPGQIKPRPPGPKPTGKTWPAMGPANLDYSLLASDDPATQRFFQLRQSGYTGPIDSDGYVVTDAQLARETATRRGEKPREGPKSAGPPARHGQNGHRCDCTKCRAEAEAVSLR